MTIMALRDLIPWSSGSRDLQRNEGGRDQREVDRRAEDARAAAHGPYPVLERPKPITASLVEWRASLNQSHRSFLND